MASKLFSPSPSFPVHHGDPSALRKGPKRSLSRLQIDVCSPFPRTLNCVYALPRSSGSIKFKRSQLTSTSELKTTEMTKRCSKTIPMRVISRDLLHHLRNKKNSRGPTVPRQVGLSSDQAKSFRIVSHVRRPSCFKMRLRTQITPQSRIRFLGARQVGL